MHSAIPSIDVHTLTLPATTTEEVHRCTSSVVHPAITHHVLPGTIGSILSGRSIGYRAGQLPYVSYVDPDDELLPACIPACLSVLKHSPAVYTNSFVIRPGRSRYPLYEHREWTLSFHRKSLAPVHQFAIMRRDIAEHALSLVLEHDDDMHMIADQAIFTAVAHICGWTFLSRTFGYLWYIHLTGAHKSTTADQADTLREFARKLDGLFC